MPDLVSIFIDGNIQKTLILTSQMLDEFIQENAKILAEISNRVNWFKTKTLITSSSEEVAKYFRDDVENAEHGLRVYNRMFGSVDHHLAMIASNFGLPELLERNGIPRSQVGEYQELIQSYWKETYGAIIDRFRRIYPYLKEMRECLEIEVEMIRKVPKIFYLEGMDRVREIHVLFEKEKTAFYNLVQEWKKDEFDDEISRLQAFCEAQLLKAKEWAKSFLALMRSNIKADLAGTQSKGRKILILLIYALGALYVILNIRKWIQAKGVKAAWNRLKLEAEAKGIKVKATQVQKAADDLVTGQFTRAIDTIFAMT